VVPCNSTAFLCVQPPTPPKKYRLSRINRQTPKFLISQPTAKKKSAQGSSQIASPKAFTVMFVLFLWVFPTFFKNFVSCCFPDSVKVHGLAWFGRNDFFGYSIVEVSLHNSEMMTDVILLTTVVT